VDEGEERKREGAPGGSVLRNFSSNKPKHSSHFIDSNEPT